jgi:hypothetical protein
MKRLGSFQALAAALAASLGLQACGGETTSSKDGPSGAGGRSAVTGGSTAVTGGSTATNATGGIGATMPAGGLASTGSGVSSGTAGTTGTMGPAPCVPTSPSGGIEWCQDQTRHRTSKVECPVELPRADYTCHGTFRQFCATDADCTEHPLGGCFAQGQGLDVCDCEYRCRTDEDCEDGGICACEGGVAGKCLPATCRTDADCGEGLQCRSYQHPESDNCDDVRFECQMAQDTCDSSYEDCHGIGERCISDATGVHQCRQHRCVNY